MVDMLYMVAETNRLLGYERVYLPLCKCADTPFHIHGDQMFSFSSSQTVLFWLQYVEMRLFFFAFLTWDLFFYVINLDQTIRYKSTSAVEKLISENSRVLCLQFNTA